jgi:hypothetical protein
MGLGGVNLGGYKTKSTPVVFGDSIYFQGTDNKLWKVRQDGTNGVHLGGYDTNSTPFVTDQYIYFQGTDDKLWRIELDGSHGVNLGRYKSKSAPVVAESFIFFQGTDNKLWRVKLDGTGGVRLGGYDTSSTPFIIQPANQPQTGTARLSHQILTVVYAPPGTNGGKSSSSVDYGTSSSTGTITSTSSSFKAGVDVSTSSGFNVGLVSLGASADFNYSTTTTDGSSVEIKKSQNFDIKVNGPAQDGINHDHDLFYLWLNPMLSVTIDPENNLN